MVREELVKLKSLPVLPSRLLLSKDDISIEELRSHDSLRSASDGVR